tara:strand:- start:546 stop:746 length:201 start_codon:yes stop_codon:yes gene_type:complete
MRQDTKLEIDQSYDNAYRLYMGEIDYDDLGEEFWLPVDHTDRDVILKHYENEEEYERCQKIVNAVS